jgi:hypothetical protein
VAGGGGSSGNRINATPTTVLARVWPGTKIARRGTSLRGWDEAPCDTLGVKFVSH